MLPGPGVCMVPLKYDIRQRMKKIYVKKYYITIIIKFKYFMFDKWKMSVALKITSKLLLQKN